MYFVMYLTHHINFPGDTPVLQRIFPLYFKIYFLLCPTHIILSTPPPLISFYFTCLLLFCPGLNPSYTPTLLVKMFCTLIICCHLVPYYYNLVNILSDPSQHCYLPDLPKIPLKNRSEISTMFKNTNVTSL